jgi:hypothetical protein
MAEYNSMLAALATVRWTLFVLTNQNSLTKLFRSNAFFLIYLYLLCCLRSRLCRKLHFILAGTDVVDGALNGEPNIDVAAGSIT